MTTQITIDNISVAYRKQTVIKDCSFSLPGGQILSLLGASGCGKSTLLKAIAGLLPLSAGRVLLADKIIADANRKKHEQQPEVGMIFQDYALFPHLTVAENVKFGLYKLSRNQQQKKCDQALETIRLSALANRYPHQLSGGQQQRVAIARTLVCSPQLMLFDEPFSNIDVTSREALMGEIKTLLKEQNITAIFVTHDKTEAFAMADKIAILEQGSISQMADPQQLYDNPKDRHIANFLGSGTILPATRSGDLWQTPIGTINAHSSQVLQIETKRPTDPAGEQTAARESEGKSQSSLFLRPHQIKITPDKKGDAKVQECRFKGDMQSYRLSLSNHQIWVTTQQRLTIGQTVSLSIHQANLSLSD